VSPATSCAKRLVADIGGTNCRLALYDPSTNSLRARHDFHNRDFKCFEDIIASWLNALQEARPTHCCMAVAAPPFGDRVTMVNIDWSFSLHDIATQFNFSQLRCINDFEGNAYALPHLGEHERVTIHRGDDTQRGKLATIGPGTGLGGATLDLSTPEPKAWASEPGHMGLAPATELELELFGYLYPAYGEVYAELLVSGPGLQLIYQGMAAVHDRESLELSSEEISRRALSGECDLCVLALSTFCALLGSISGDYVLANGAYGGLFLAGGFIAQMIDFLRASTFLTRLQRKGKMQSHLARVPVHVITSTSTGLLGAAHAPM
jgi:glucokinase